MMGLIALSFYFNRHRRVNALLTAVACAWLILLATKVIA
jgi:hypothetical protein